MPRKLRELESDLLRAGFVREEGKGSHRKYSHHKLPGVVTISGKGGNDAKVYQERQVQDAIEKSKA